MHKSVQAVWQIREQGDELATPTTLEVPKGERLVLAVEVLRNDGTIPDLRSCTVTFRMVDFNLSPVYRVSAAGNLLGWVSLTANLPAAIMSGTYSWDLWLETSTNERYQIKPLGAFRLSDTTYSLV